MKVGIIGLGLIGGSMAKAYKRDESVRVFGADTNAMIVEFACLAEAIDGRLTDEMIPEMDLIFLAAYPQAAVYLVDNPAIQIRQDPSQTAQLLDQQAQRAFGLPCGQIGDRLPHGGKIRRQDGGCNSDFISHSDVSSFPVFVP